MRLVLVADTFPPLRTSGAVQLRDLTREFVRQGHELTVLLPAVDLDGAWQLSDLDGVRLLRLAAPRTKDVNYVRRTLSELVMPFAMRRNLRKSPLANERWEGVIWYSPSIFHGPLIRALKAQSRCKSYLILRDIFPEWALDLGVLRPGPVYAFFKWVAKQQYEVADIIGVQSPGNLGFFARWKEKGAGRQLEVLQNWLSPPSTSPCSIDVGRTAIAGRKIFVYAGNMGVAQDLDLVLNLAERMHAREDLGFLLVGRGSEAARLEELSRARGLDNVVFFPEIDPDEIPQLYAQCAAGIVSLDKRHTAHNIPGKFLTYMQCGLPALAIVNRGNDLAQMIRDEEVGEVCESHDLAELEMLAEKLLQRIDDDASLSHRCVELFDQNFSVSNTVKQIVAALQNPQPEQAQP